MLLYWPVRVLTDLSPLRRSPGFRRLWVGSTLSSSGSAFTAFVVPLQIYEATHSSLAVGGLGMAQLVPLIAVGLVGGRIADTIDRRQVLLGATTASTVVSALLAVQALAGLRVLWLLYALVAVNAAAGAISAPARRALVPGLLSEDQLAAGLALNRVTFQLMLALGPALAGLVVSAPGLGLPACYVLDTASFIASFWGVAGLRVSRARPARPGDGEVRPGATRVVEGLRIVRRSQPLVGALVADVTATAFALPVVLFPAINATRFGGNPETLGLFTAGYRSGRARNCGPVAALHRAAARVSSCWLRSRYGAWPSPGSLWCRVSGPRCACSAWPEQPTP